MGDNAFLKTIERYQGNPEAKYEVQYVDSSGYTVPVLLTHERAYRLKNDASVKKVRITWRDVQFEITP